MTLVLVCIAVLPSLAALGLVFWFLHGQMKQRERETDTIAVVTREVVGKLDSVYRDAIMATAEERQRFLDRTLGPVDSTPVAKAEEKPLPEYPHDISDDFAGYRRPATIHEMPNGAPAIEGGVEELIRNAIPDDLQAQFGRMNL